MKVKITILNSKSNKSKVPESFFKDRSHVFETINVNFRDLPYFFANYYILSTNCIFPQKTTIKRRKIFITPYKTKRLSYIILDIDHVKTLEDKNKIINYFKEKDYYIILLQSRSYNNKNNFNLKGLFLVNGNNNKESIKYIIEKINNDIKNFGIIDLSIISESSFQAPTLNSNIELLNEGKYIPEIKVNFEIKEVKEIKKIVDNKILQKCIEIYKQKNFLPVKIKDNNIIVFEHPLEKTKRGYFLFVDNPLIMHHFNKIKTFNIFKEISKTKEGKEYFKKLNEEKRKQFFSEDLPALIENKRFININNNIDDLITKFLNEKNSVLRIKSGMGTGKSTIIQEIIKKTNKRILIITNRVSLAKDIHQKYNCKLYSNNDYEINDNLVVQYDSLWKYSLKYFDIVILDEFISLLLHTRNHLTNHNDINRSKLYFALKKQCVLADAFLFGYEKIFFKNRKIFSYQNNYRDDINLFQFKNIDSFLFKLFEVLKKEKENNFKNKISISTTSKKMSELLYFILKQKGYKVILLNSDTSEFTKQNIYKNFLKENHNYWDIIIFTPTLTVGVSNNNYIKHHFHFDTSNSADVISSLQMIKRSRKAENIYMYIKYYNKLLITNKKLLEKIILKNKESNFFDFDENGDLKISEIGNFILDIEILYNTLESNHKQSFEILLKHQFKNDPKIINYSEKFPLKEYRQQLKKEQEKEAKIILNNLKINWNENIIKDFKEKSYESNKILKLISEIKKFINSNDKKTLLRIAEKEIKENFNYLNKLKLLKIFITNTKEDLEKLNSFFQNLNDTKILQYMITLKEKDIKFFYEYSLNDIKELEKQYEIKNFKWFLKKIGYCKIEGIYFLKKEVLEDLKLLK